MPAGIAMKALLPFVLLLPLGAGPPWGSAGLAPVITLTPGDGVPNFTIKVQNDGEADVAMARCRDGRHLVRTYFVYKTKQLNFEDADPPGNDRAGDENRENSATMRTVEWARHICPGSFFEYVVDVRYKRNAADVYAVERQGGEEDKDTKDDVPKP